MMVLQGEMLENFEAYSHKGIYHIIFNHKKRPYNFFDSQTLQEFDTLLSFVENGQYKGLVLASGKQSFVVGANVKDFVEAHDAPDSMIEGILRKGQSLFNRIEDLGIPSVAIMRGINMGGGLEVALACTSRVLIEDPKPENPKYHTFQMTKLALPEVKLGIIPSWGGTTRLPRMIYPTKAIELICSGRNVGQKEALKIGLVDRVVSYVDAMDSAYNIIDTADYLGIREKKIGPTSLGRLRASITYPIVRRTIAKKQKKMFGSSNKYPSPYKALKVLKDSRTLCRDESLELEIAMFVKLVKTVECRELVGRFLRGERE